jgi:hypothetical protein
MDFFHALHGTAWNCMKTVSYCMELHENSFTLHETAWNCMEFHVSGMKTWTFATERKKCCAHDMPLLIVRLSAKFIK